MGFRVARRERRRPVVGRRGRRGLPPGIERLEGRVVLSTSTTTFTWTGADATTSTNWSDGKNWMGGTAPTGLSANSEVLVFPAGVSGAALNSVDNIASGSFAGLTIQGSGYALSPSTGTTATVTGTVDASLLSGSAAISIPLSASTFQVNSAQAALEVSGAITSTGLTKTGAGTLTLTAAGNAISSTSTVEGGTLQVDTPGAISGNVALQTGGAISGTGSLGAISANGGVVSPGDSVTSPGTLTASGLNLNSTTTPPATSSFHVAINGDTSGTYSQLDVTGTSPINLGGATLNLAIGAGYSPTSTGMLTILKNNTGQAITGTFAGLPDGATVLASGDAFTIHYNTATNGDVTLTPIAATNVDTWKGTDATTTTPGKWSDPNNWSNGVPTAGASLVFPALSGAALSSLDDISGGTFGPILIQGAGYSITAGSGVSLTLNGGIDASAASGSSTFAVPITASGSSAVFVSVDGASTAGLTLGSAITGSGGLVKSGPGLLDLKGSNAGSLIGTTTVAAGTLLIDGSAGSVAVAPGATLGGSGSINGALTSSGGGVSPGDTSSTAILTASSLSLDSGSTFFATLGGTAAGTGFDQFVASGAVNIAGALNVSLAPSFSPQPNASFPILKASSLTGTFNGLPEGATVIASGYPFTISYQNNSVTLTSTVLSPFTWTGHDTASANGGNDNWSDPGNWSGGVAPTSGDTLVFPANLTIGSTGYTTNNDIPGATFFVMDIQAGGYTINGQGIGLATGLDANIPTTGTSTSSTVALPIQFNPNGGTVTVDNAGTSLVLSGTVTGSTGISKAGSGTLGLTGNDSSLTAVVDAGTLLVDGSASAVSIANTGTLGGTGQVGTVSTNGGTISPGDSSTSLGTLTDNGALVLDPTATFAATLGASSNDQVKVTGTGNAINLQGAKLAITLGTGFPTAGGQSYTILSNQTGSTITGTFANQPQGSTLTIGSQQFQISYTGGSGHDVVLTNLYSTTTTLGSVPSSLVSGQSVTLTATVAKASGSTATSAPTGTVTFLNGSTTLGTATINASGLATLTTTNLTAGTDQISASYSGDTTFGTSTSTTVAAVVAKASTTTIVTASPSPGVAGQLVSLTAQISIVSPGGGSPSGTVTFMNGTTAIGSPVSVSGGVAVLNTTSLGVGTSTITAVYSGDSNFNGSTSPAISEVVKQGSTSVTVSSSLPNPYALQSVTLTAIVSLATGTGTPSGTVTFEANGTSLGTATLSSGEATLTTQHLPVGTAAITAVYSGDANFAAMTSPTLSIVVGHPTDLYVNQVYLDIFGTPAGYAGTYWIGLLNAGYPRKVITREILQSVGAKRAAVEHTYLSTLGRIPTSAELNRSVNSGNTSTNPLTIRLLGSAEFYKNAGSTTDGFLTALAKDLFGSSFPAPVQTHLAAELARGKSRTEIARQILNSPSGVRGQVNTVVESVLGRPATASDNRQLAPLIRSGNQIGVYETLFSSREFLTKYTQI